MYADPEDLDEFDFQTVRYFTERYRHLDWLINFPVSGAVRQRTGSCGDAHHRHRQSRPGSRGER